MTYQVLARRLRPQRFGDVIGQEHVTRTLQAAMAAGRVAHAFLLTGPRGVGKTTTARILAKALNCETATTGEPCNACSTCQEVADGIAFDVLEIDGASHTQVDKMRDLMETVAHRPIKSRYKIYIIDEVHMLSSHSFNALLKTLEEPPPHVKFIFATTDPHKVLATVVSRCQRFDLRRIGLAELTTHLRRIVADEGLALSDDAVALVAREAEGSLRDAQSLLEQVLTAAGAGADETAVRAVLGAADRRLVGAVAEAIIAGDAAGCLRQLAALYEHGYDAQRFCRDLLEHFRHLAVLAATNDRSLVADLPEAEVVTLIAQAARRSADDLQRFFALLLEADEALALPARTVDPQLVLEMRVLRLATLPPLLPIADILARLDALAAGQPVPTRAVATPSRPPVRATPAVAVADGELWDRLLARVRQERIALYMALASGRPLGVQGDVLRIGIESDAMRRELATRENLDRIQTIAGELAGRAMRVEVGPVPAEHAADTPLAQARRRTEETLADPLVQAAVEIFGAEVRGVRDRRP
ncbi:MAG TPA: DNA polymerase III subunit gamma/tau [Candidatus Binatia bacterium]|jgi:DNA polymerase-3 subunit gamma/tau|nr:DNA polymerase III subunit gamma/tau [Candidatus Binatia bacterium]